jgi:dTDP-4-dehydrorhamnose reductase
LRIALFGASGQVGWELRRSLAIRGEIALMARAGGLRHDGWTGDLGSLHGLRDALDAMRPDCIVNAAAYTAVDGAESDQELSRTVNAHAPAVMAEYAASAGALLVHYSTDYVFDGSGSRAWREDDVPRPLSHYGRTKLEGEELIRAAACRHLIFRTSWVYSARGTNFVRTILRLAREKDSLSVVSDQFGAPTGADLLADITSCAVEAASKDHALEGTYHVTSAGETSWHLLARYVVSRAIAAGLECRLRPEAILPIPSSEYRTVARRPLNSRLDCRKVRHAIGIVLPDWPEGVDRAVSELTGRGQERIG